MVAVRSPQTPRARMERTLTGMSLQFPHVRDPAVEWAAFPSMAGIYWGLVRDALPPPQLEFAAIVADTMGQPEHPAIMARACRAYPSFVRQHHAELLLRERFPVVVHGENLDHAGVDILVVDRWFAVGLALMVNTPGARTWRLVKQQRHPDPPGLPILGVYADPEDFRVGPFWLHAPTLIEETAAFLDQQRGHALFS
jgi:hypothetical protein